MGSTLFFENGKWIRQRLILSVLSGKTIKISNIRASDDSPGLKEHEASLIRLLDKVSNGTVIEINESGTKLYFQPGLLSGGKFEHDCNQERSISYYLEPLLYLAPFFKEPISAVLRGITNDNLDPSVDLVKSSMLPVLQRFLGTDDGLELAIRKRGVAPGGGGEVYFKCPHRMKLRPLQLTKSGKIKRIRGCAYALRVSPSSANRIMNTAKGMLTSIIPDVYIYTDHRKGADAGKSPGYGLHLVAETTEGCFYSAEYFSEPPSEDKTPMIPEDLAAKTVQLFLKEIFSGGCVDRCSQSLTAMLMTLGDKDVSKVTIGSLTPHTIQLLRHIKQYFGVMFNLEWEANTRKQEEEIDSETQDELKLGGEKIIMTCIGAGYVNLNKKLM